LTEFATMFFIPFLVSRRNCNLWLHRICWPWLACLCKKTTQ